jgi:hypothetical protein
VFMSSPVLYLASPREIRKSQQLGSVKNALRFMKFLSVRRATYRILATHRTCFLVGLRQIWGFSYGAGFPIAFEAVGLYGAT